jgi:Fuc2NAc and GlcNAc transferase
MNTLWPFVYSVVALVMTWWLTGRFRSFAVARRILDVPNERSSHQVPTPRGAGLALAATSIVVLGAAGAVQFIPWSRLWGLLAAGALMAAVGFAEDRRGVPRRWRLAAQCGAALLMLRSAGDAPSVVLSGFAPDYGLLASVIFLLYIVWLLNLTNFMDGIDGIAAVESISVGLMAVVLYIAVGAEAAQWSIPLIVAAATSGFLIWNWAPAKVFLGDAGSGFLGVVFAALPLHAVDIASRLFWAWMILLGVFIVDATVTLCRRIARGDRFYDAHRMHAYQHAVRRCGSHRRITVLVAVVNCVWLFPIAVAVSSGMLPGTGGVLIAYAPLILAALVLGAGVPEKARVEAPVELV